MVAKIIRIFAIVIISIILLNLVLFIVLSIPTVQKKAATIAIEKLEPIIGTDVQLEGIRLRLFNTVELKGLYVEDQQNDTLLYVETITARLRALELLKNRLYVQKAGLENFTANVYRESPDDPFNFQFIIDAFVSDKDTTVVEKDKKPMRITVDEVILKEGSLHYHVHSQPLTPGKFNASHFDVEGFNFKANADYNGLEDLRAEVELLEFAELNSGVVLNDLSADVRGVDSLLTSNGVVVSLNNSDINVSSASYDLRTKDFAAAVVSRRLEPSDVAVFYEPLHDLDKPVSFELDAEGQIPNAILSRFEFSYGNDTRFDIIGEIEDFSNAVNSNLNVDIKTLDITQADLESIIMMFAKEYETPAQLAAMGDMSVRMKADGTLGRFNYNGAIDTKQGDITLNGVGRIKNGLSFEGPVRANNIIVANIIGEGAGVENATLATNAKIVIPQNKDSLLTVTATGVVEEVTYKETVYNDIHFNGVYRGTNVVANINMDNPDNQFDLFGDISFGNEMGFIVKGDVQKLDLRPFIMMESWSAPSLSTTIDVNMAGRTIDDIAGTLVIENTSIMDSSFIYNPGPIYMQALADTIEGKKIQIMSTFLEAEVTGDYYFTTIGEEIKRAVGPHLPSVLGQTEVSSDGFEDDFGDGFGGKNNFSFNILLKNTEDFSYTFELPFYNVDNATIKGNVNMPDNGSLAINAHVPRLMFGNNDIRETKLDVNGGDTGLNLDVNTYLIQNNGFINAKLNSSASMDSVINRIYYDVTKNNNSSVGELLITMGFNRGFEDVLATNIHIHPATIDFNGTDIQVNEALIAMGHDRIEITNFGIREADMLLLGIEGVASKSEADNIRIFFNNTELANILAVLNISNFEGSINGSIYVRQALETPMIRTEDLRIEDIKVYNDTIGTLIVEGDWDQSYSGLNLNSYLVNQGDRSLTIKGFVPTGDESPFPMDVNVLIENFELRALQPLTTNLFSKLSGYLNSNISITGKPSEPVTEGWLGIDEGEMRVAYTNVTYFISDTIKISRDNVGLENLVIRDQNNNMATLNVSLTHTNFGRMIYSAGLKFNDFMLLNNSDRTDLMAYGNLKLTGELNVTGSPVGIYGDGNLSTRSLSNVTVVLPQTAKATEYQGVVYINTPQEDSLSFLKKEGDPISQVNNSPATSIPIIMNARINLNDLFSAKVVLDPTTGNALEVSGEGEINVNYNSKSTPPVRLYGDYVIDTGKFHYNLQNLRTIDFTIREGSRLTMEGDPLNTQFNIIAYLPVRADLAALSPTFANELSNTRVPVNALLQIRGDLEAMDLQYDIELPESSNDVQQRVNSFIRDEETKILQFAYLATTGSFIPSEGSPDLNFGSSVFTNFAANTLSRGLDALFASALSDNWSISTNLESVDGTLDNVRMGVDVSTRLLDNRLRVTTNLSYGDNSMMASHQAFMGEFEVEYDIYNWLMLRAFNRANEKFYSRTPTTQGIGVVVTKEAQSVRDLFRFRFIRQRDDREGNNNE